MREYLAEKRLAAEVGIMLAARRMKECAKRLVQDERGDTNFVAIIIIIVILIAIAAIFHDALSSAIRKVFQSLEDFIDANPGEEL
ncbi:MAG: hypothetical protein HDR30_04375 [Lachnospiraceae bacterium]|nr:hypothetical protein [Lachnospiraceae bacterium]